MKTKCILCNHSNKIVFLNKVFGFSYPVCFCQNCELYYFSKQPTDKILSTYYRKDYFKNYKEDFLICKIKSIFAKMRAFSQYLYIKKILSQRTNNKELSVLEVGPGDGYLSYLFKISGSSVLGLEQNEFMTQKAEKELGIKYLNDDIFSLKNRHFDLILLSHVLEHFSDPLKFLSKCRELLKKDGLIFVEVPDSPFPTDISVNRLHRYLNTTHIYNFKPKSQRAILKKTGFKIISQDKFDYNIPKAFKKNRKEISWILLSGQIPKSKFLFLQALCVSLLAFIKYFIGRDPLEKKELNSICDSESQFIRCIAERLP